MEMNQRTYPWFEANQVLTPEQLNGVFGYLDEQQRSTRANLIGIGIACGLTIDYDPSLATVRLSAGVGVTSEGYLIVEQKPVTLISRRRYTLPPEYGYRPFIRPGSDPDEQFALWELLEEAPADAPAGTVSLAEVPPDELAGQVVLLFLELRKDGLRNCSPNSCDDLGAEVTATVRRLLIGIDDLDALTDVVRESHEPVVAGAGVLGERLRLPDLRMPRFDVPNSTPVTSEEVLRAFQRPFRRPDRLASATASALTALYRALRGLIADDYDTNPFQDLAVRYEFLDRGPKDVDQVRRLQHYWGLFDDLIAAYDELRWKAADLLCACCPPDWLFPRHLMAGLLDASGRDRSDYRHAWQPSPAVGDCAARAEDVRILFRRLVTMVRSFSARLPGELRITPSRWAAPLSAKAIPYYYAQTDVPPLYEVWDPEKTARRRASQNLGYRSDEYVPPAPPFVTDPLRFELAPNDFLRVEGHLGRNVWTVMEQLLALRRTHRLPFQVVALRTGALDEDVEIDLIRERCRFQDLEALYDALAAELHCFLVKEVRYLYDLPLNYGVERTETPPTLEFLRLRASGFTVKPKTLGRWIDDRIDKVRGASLVAGDWQSAAEGLIAALVALGEAVSDDVRQLDAAEFRTRYEDLQETAAILLELALDKKVKGLEGLPGRLDDILFRCRLAPFQAIADEYLRRVREAKQAQFLGHFLERHPGIQHKAGVPLGGTLVLVYHELAKPIRGPRRLFGLRPERLQGALTGPLLGSSANLAAGGPAAASGLSQANLDAIQEALARLPFNTEVSLNPDIQQLYRNLTGDILIPRQPIPDEATTIYSKAVAELPAGTVIADFFLPYACGSDCGSMVYQLPPPPLRVSARVGCTDPEGQAPATLTVEGARGEVSVQVDGGDFRELAGPLSMTVGDHRVVVRDSAGTESELIQVPVPPPLRVEAGANESEDGRTYTAQVTLGGGTPPYTVSYTADPPVDEPGPMVLAEGISTSPPVSLTSKLTVTVTDTAGCGVEQVVQPPETCDLPCNGDAVREGFRFWLPHPVQRIDVMDIKLETFTITGDEIGTVEPDKGRFTKIVLDSGQIDANDFPDIVAGWLVKINGLIAEAVGSSEWVELTYQAPTGRGFGTLFIDRLACLDVVLRLEVRYSLPEDEAPGEPTHDRVLYFGYTGEGTFVADENADGKASIPVFDVSRSNKCRPDEPPTRHCSETDLGVTIVRSGRSPDRVHFSLESSGQDRPAGYLWEFQGGSPSLSHDEQVDVTFERKEPPEKLIRLMVVTEGGCVVSTERTINVFEEDG